MTRSHHRHQRTLLVCLLAASCQAALAQQAAPPLPPAAADTDSTDTAAASPPAAGTAKTLDSVVVTGVRKANAAAMESKRAATNITDVVSSTDVRALPDTTIVEALRRIPG